MTLSWHCHCLGTASAQLPLSQEGAHVQLLLLLYHISYFWSVNINISETLSQTHTFLYQPLFYALEIQGEFYCLPTG